MPRTFQSQEQQRERRGARSSRRSGQRPPQTLRRRRRPSSLSRRRPRGERASRAGRRGHSRRRRAERAWRRPCSRRAQGSCWTVPPLLLLRHLRRRRHRHRRRHPSRRHRRRQIARTERRRLLLPPPRRRELPWRSCRGEYENRGKRKRKASGERVLCLLVLALLLSLSRSPCRRSLSPSLSPSLALCPSISLSLSPSMIISLPSSLCLFFSSVVFEAPLAHTNSLVPRRGLPVLRVQERFDLFHGHARELVVLEKGKDDALVVFDARAGRGLGPVGNRLSEALEQFQLEHGVKFKLSRCRERLGGVTSRVPRRLLHHHQVRDHRAVEVAQLLANDTSHGAGK